MQPTKIQKFTELIRVLEATPEECFDMSEWSCGSVNCIIGGAALDPWFNAQGLTLNPNDTPEWDGWSSWDAVNAFFGVDNDTASRLFMGCSKSCRLPEDTVAARVKLLTEYRDSL